MDGVPTATPNVNSPSLNAGNFYKTKAGRIMSKEHPIGLVINPGNYFPPPPEAPDMDKYVLRENVWGLA
jgi:hypothetical protein